MHLFISICILYTYIHIYATQLTGGSARNAKRNGTKRRRASIA
jgi:hypothetical protein